MFVVSYLHVSSLLKTRISSHAIRKQLESNMIIRDVYRRKSSTLSRKQPYRRKLCLFNHANIDEAVCWWLYARRWMSQRTGVSVRPRPSLAHKRLTAGWLKFAVQWTCIARDKTYNKTPDQRRRTRKQTLNGYSGYIGKWQISSWWSICSMHVQLSKLYVDDLGSHWLLQL